VINKRIDENILLHFIAVCLYKGYNENRIKFKWNTKRKKKKKTHKITSYLLCITMIKIVKISWWAYLKNINNWFCVSSISMAQTTIC